MPRVSIANSRIKGLQVEFSGLFQNRLKGSQERKMLNRVMDFIPSRNSARTETFHYFEAGPGFRRWDRGEPRVYGDLADVSWEVEILRWENGIEWDRLDEEDDLTGRFRQAMGSIANKAILVDIEVFFQMLQGSTDPDRLASLPTGADGLAVYSSSRSSFGANGDIVAGSGVATVASIKRDLFRARKRINGLVDQKGDLYHRENVFLDGITIIFNDQHLERFAEAFQAKYIQGVNAGIENVVQMESWMGPVTLWPSTRITDDSWYVFAEGVPEKYFFALERRDLGSEPEQLYKDENNCSHCAEYDVRRMLYRMRKGYNRSQNVQSVKVSNT